MENRESFNNLQQWSTTSVLSHKVEYNTPETAFLVNEERDTHL